MKRSNVIPAFFGEAGIAIGMLLLARVLCAQTPVATSSASDAAVTVAVRELQQQVVELRAAVVEMRSEAAQYRAETTELRRELQAMRGQPEDVSARATPYTSTAPQSAVTSGAVTSTAEANATVEQRVANLEEVTQLLDSKLQDQYQTKIESASKYRVRLSGIVLVNLFSNRGTTDNDDIPSIVYGPNQGNGSFGATLRQSEIGLEVFGPALWGAKTSANLQADFAGGFPATWNGVNSGIFRLRTANARLDWSNTSLVVGQDDLFVSPLSPTSFASLAVPAFNYAGNLWAWTPQVRVEHRFDLSDNQSVQVQAGILDNLTGEFPSNSYFRAPGPGEASGQPAYGVRTAWTTGFFGKPLTLGTAGYYGRQNWGLGHSVDGWAGMADWEIPLFSRFSLSGEFYRGRAVGGIGGGISQSVFLLGPQGISSTPVRGLDSRGGWSQVKFRATDRLEFNVGVGVDNPTASEVRIAAGNEPVYDQNRSGLVNFVYRPKSSLLFSAEYRHLQTFDPYSSNNSAQQVNMMMGVLF